VTAVYLRFNWTRAALQHGWWLVTSVYLVLDAGLSPAQLVLVAVAQGVVALTFEIPAGVLADTVSRKWSLVVSQVLMGTAMAATGLVTGFLPVLLTQMLWGLAWTFASGADVAWITDELADPVRVPAVLARAGRAQLTGAAAGMVGFGVLASVLGRGPAMVIAGAGAVLLGGYVVARFPERGFVPAAAQRWRTSRVILRRGTDLIRASRTILLLLVATFLVNGALDAARLFALRLVDVGFPTEPLIYYTGLGVLALLVGAVALRVVERHVDRVRAGYLAACASGAIGLAGLAAAPDPVTAGAAVLLVTGVAAPLTRTAAAIWVNRLTTSDVRATVHSFLAQGEYAGEIVCGALIAAIARSATLPVTLLACAALFLIAIAVAGRAADRTPACG
jgi:MFS family permease